MCATAEWPLHLAEMDGGPAHGLLHHGADSESSGPQRWLTHSSAGADPVPLGSGSDFRCSTGWSDEPLQWAVRRPTGPPPGAAAAAGRELPAGPAAARATAQPACQGRRRRLSRCTFPLDRPVSPPQSTVSCRYATLTGAAAFCWERWGRGWPKEEPCAGFGCAAAVVLELLEPGFSSALAPHIMENYGAGWQGRASTRAQGPRLAGHHPPRRQTRRGGSAGSANAYIHASIALASPASWRCATLEASKWAVSPAVSSRTGGKPVSLASQGLPLICWALAW